MSGDVIFYKKLLDAIADGVYFVDLNRNITYWSSGATKITGYASDEVLGKSCSENLLVHVNENGQNLCVDGCPLLKSMKTNTSHKIELYLNHKDGHRVPVQIQAAPIHDPSGNIIGSLEIFHDMTAIKEDRTLIEELKTMTLLDSLTGIPNRRYIDMKITSALQEMERHGIPLGIILADIDHFKHFNDVYGHLIGDEILKIIASTLSCNIRVSDMAGRWGGEEFIIILQHVDHPILKKIAGKLRALVEASILHNNDEMLHATISMGACLAKAEDTQETLIQRADNLLYRAKEQGRNRVLMD